MQRLLERAGVSKEILELIPSIVDTCVACRKWASPLPDAQASIEIVDKFNAEVECDLLFIYKYIIMHFVDRCTRWHHAVVVPDKHAISLTNGIDTWHRIHGSMQTLIVDGERGLTIAELAKEYCASHSITLRQRAPQQHARIIERRGALVRDAIHRLDAQLQIEGIIVPFDQRLSDIVFSGNALLSINDSTPYNAVYGRTPPLLPGLEILNDDGDIATLTNRTVGRVREIAVQSIVEGTARSKLTRAIKTRTLPAAETQELHTGDEIE